MKKTKPRLTFDGAQTIRVWHEDRGTSAKGLAAQFGLSERHIRRILAGEAHPSIWDRAGRAANIEAAECEAAEGVERIGRMRAQQGYDYVIKNKPWAPGITGIECQCAEREAAAARKIETMNEAILAWLDPRLGVEWASQKTTAPQQGYAPAIAGAAIAALLAGLTWAIWG